MDNNTDYSDWFLPFKIGINTDKGVIDDLFFLQFDGSCGAHKIREPIGKGILMAGIGKKMYAIGNLKIESNG